MPRLMPGCPAISFSAPVLPRLSLTEVEAHSVIAKHGVAVTLALPWPADALLDTADQDASTTQGGIALWQLGFSAGYSEALHVACTVRRDLEWAGAHLRLQLSCSALSAWASASLPDASIADLSEPWISAAVETLLTQICQAVDLAHTSARLRVCETPVSDRRLRHAWTLTARHLASGHTTHALLEADGLGLLLLASLIKRAPRADNGLHEDDLPVAVHADLGWTTLHVTELQGLRPGDTVFIDHYRVMPEGDLWLVAAGQGLRVRPVGNSYCVTQAWTSLMNEIPEIPGDRHERDERVDDDLPAAGPAARLDVDAIPVTVTFCLGERQLTLGELRSLQPGETFDLARPLASGPVIVRANGAWLGTGDLVDIDGRIGVTVRTLGEPQT